jgi:hypothetical protein
MLFVDNLHFFLQFVKDLHVAFIKQMESLWNKVSTFLWNHWHSFLHTIEPSFIKVLHYLENAAWKASREILGNTHMYDLNLAYCSKISHAEG